MRDQPSADEHGADVARQLAWRKALRMAIVYALLGVLWIIGTDALLENLVGDPAELSRLQTFKGWFYVAVTAVLLYVVLYRLLRNEAVQRQQQTIQRNDLHALSLFRESVIDNASIWINVLDEQARVTVWNKAAEQISGYAREEVIGRADIWQALYPDEDYRNDISTRVMAILKDGLEVEGLETCIRCRDGHNKIISWNSRRFFDGKGELGSIAIGQDITERKRMQQELEQLAVCDALTGLYNRREFEALAKERLAVSVRDGHGSAMLWIDIDGFKGVNDRFGHQVGDDVLCRVAGFVQDAVGDHGIAARYGGDELVAALPGSDPGEAFVVAEQVRRQVQQARLLSAHDKNIDLTVSIGVASCLGAACNLESLVAAADLAMYRAKDAGRNRVCDADGTSRAAGRNTRQAPP